MFYYHPLNISIHKLYIQIVVLDGVLLMFLATNPDMHQSSLVILLRPQRVPCKYLDDCRSICVGISTNTSPKDSHLHADPMDITFQTHTSIFITIKWGNQNNRRQLRIHDHLLFCCAEQIPRKVLDMSHLETCVLNVFKHEQCDRPWIYLRTTL